MYNMCVLTKIDVWLYCKCLILNRINNSTHQDSTSQLPIIKSMFFIWLWSHVLWLACKLGGLLRYLFWNVFLELLSIAQYVTETSLIQSAWENADVEPVSFFGFPWSVLRYSFSEYFILCFWFQTHLFGLDY